MHRPPSYLTHLGIYLSLVIGSSSLHATDLVEWQSANIQLLRGWDYAVGKEQRSIVTTEYANRWKYGDVFVFIDGTRFDGGDTTVYGEISPRFSISKMTGDNYSSGIIKDVLIAATLERGKYDIRAYLLGISLDLDLPGFAFFSSSLYLRNNPKLSNDTWQLTLAWKYPFQIAGTHFITEGFSDIAGDADTTYHHNQYVVPRLLMDISPFLGAQQRQLWLGIEYSYWKNKFGINGVTESHPQIQLKWVF